MVQNPNMKIGFRDFTQEVEWSGGSWREEYPITNVGVIEQARVARSTDLSVESCTVRATLPRERPIQLIGIVLPNCSITAEFRLTRRDYYGEAFDDTGWLKVYPEVYRQGDLNWQDQRFWTRSYTTDEIAGFKFTRPYDTDDIRMSMSVEIQFNDPANEDGFLDVSYISLAESWQLLTNMSWGSSHGFDSRSKVVQARGGAKSFDRLPKPRRLTAQLDDIEHEEAMSRVYELQRQADITDAVLVHPYPDEPGQWLRTTFVARQRQLSPIERAVYGFDSTQLEFDEVM